MMALMNGKTAKLCATDPPYLVSYDAKSHPSKNFSDGKNKDWKGRYADKQKSEPLGPFYEAFLREALALCENDAGIYVWRTLRSGRLKSSRPCGTAGFSFTSRSFAGQEQAEVLTHSFYMWQHEPCFFGWKQGNKPKRNSGNFPTTVAADRCPDPARGLNRAIPRKKPLELFTTPILAPQRQRQASFATNHSRDRGHISAPLRIRADAASRWKSSRHLWRSPWSGYLIWASAKSLVTG